MTIFSLKKTVVQVQKQQHLELSHLSELTDKENS